MVLEVEGTFPDFAHLIVRPTPRQQDAAATPYYFAAPQRHHCLNFPTELDRQGPNRFYGEVL